MCIRDSANAKPGIIMDAFAMAGESSLVFIINELDKAASGKGNGNPADVLLTLLDNLGFTDNYIECMIPTSGVYPIATANDKEQISAPILSRFAAVSYTHLDAIATSAGAVLGTSTTTTFVESSAGVGAGARTGLASIVTGLLFLLAIFFAPIFTRCV